MLTKRKSLLDSPDGPALSKDYPLLSKISSVVKEQSMYHLKMRYFKEGIHLRRLKLELCIPLFPRPFSLGC